MGLWHLHHIQITKRNDVRVPRINDDPNLERTLEYSSNDGHKSKPTTLVLEPFYH
jgi:hypothetical protein